MVREDSQSFTLLIQLSIFFFLYYSADGNTTRIEAIDIDQPDTPNSVVVYELYGPNKGVLHIDPSSGNSIADTYRP